MTDESDGSATMGLSRRYLLAVGAAGLGGLAGCSGDGDGDGTTAPTTDAPTTTSTTPPTSSTTTATSTTSRPTTTATTTTTTPPPDVEQSAIDPDDGFATVAPWLTDDVAIYRVTAPTRYELEQAFGANEPRVVVFETSGTIDLEWSSIEITGDKCWVAGQTAPSPGINLIRGTMFVSADDCVVQHIRVRRGEREGAGEGKDAISTGDDTRNNVIDHVSAYWGRDENLSVGYRSTNTTVANCLIAEGLSEPAENSNGSLIGDNAENVAILGNIYASNLDRNPRLKDGTWSVVANTMGYNFNEACNLSGGATVSFVGNPYIRPIQTGDSIVDHQGNAYVEDCFVADPPLEDGTPFVSDVPQRLTSKPLWPSGFTAMPADEVEAHNTRFAGARPADRDDHDRRIIENIRNRTGDIIGKQGDVGGHLSLAENTHSLEVPDSGLRQWLAEWGWAVEDPNTPNP